MGKRKPKRMEPEEVKLLVRLLRACHRWSQDELAAKAGIDAATVLRIEKGTVTTSQAMVERLIAAVGLPVDVAQSVLPPVIRLLRSLLGPDGDQAQASTPTVRRIEGWLEAWLFRGDLVEDLETASGAALSGLMAEAVARGALAELERRGIPTLAERLCGASIRAAPHDAGEAVELARLAVRAAQNADGNKAWRMRLEGWAHGFLANGLRLSGQLLEAEAEWRETWRLWRAGQDPERQLPEWRLLDLEASLRRDQMRPAEALTLLDRALGNAPPEVRGRLLINAASALEQAGDIPGSLKALGEAVALIGDHGDLRERWCVVFNLSVNLCHERRFAEAGERLKEARDLARGLGNDLDNLRVTWLSARVDAGLGRREEARSALAEVRNELVRRSDALDAAVVSLEIAVIDLEAGRTAEVKALAEEMAAIFSAVGIESDALRAMKMFWKAALQETVTVAQAKELILRLEEREPLRWMGRD